MSIISFAESEYGLLTDVLLCRPKNLPAEAGSTTHLTQYQGLVDALEANKIKCHYISEKSYLPYQCYTRDSSVSTPWGLLISNMGFIDRHAEPNVIDGFAKENKIRVWEYVAQGHFEGGDLLLLSPGYVAIGTNSVRTNYAAASQIKMLFEAKGWNARIFEYSANYVHLDLLLGVLDSENILCASEILKESDLDWIKEIGFNLHNIDTNDLHNLPCNFLAIGNRHIICSQNNIKTNKTLRDLGYQVTEIDIGKFIEDSGGIHCLVHALRRTPYSV